MSIHLLPAGKTLIVNGPASIRLLEGSASILGCPLSSKKPVVVKSWRSRPVYAHEDSKLEYTFGEGGSVEEVDGNTVPDDWMEAVEELTREYVVVAIYGASDSGKTSLATLAANLLASSRGSSIFFDLDVGQSSICAPTTIGYVRLRHPVPDISQLRMEEGEAVGYVSPTPLVERHLKAISKIYHVLRSKFPGVSVVADLDGWVGGGGALEHKLKLLDILKPTHVFSLGAAPSKLRDYCDERGARLVELSQPPRVRKRSLEVRRRLREMAYERFLRKSVVRTIQASWVELVSAVGERRLQDILSTIGRVVSGYAEEKGVLVDEGPSELEEVAKNERAGILSYTYDLEERFAGIGLLMALNPRKNQLRIYTPFQAQMRRIVIGTILLSTEGVELYSIPPLRVR